MAPNNFYDRQFKSILFSEDPLPEGIYDNCDFSDCDFSYASLSGIRFTGCRFTRCNLSLAKVATTIFREVSFFDCKMLAIRFYHNHELGCEFRFENCKLDQSSFYGTKIKNTLFKHTSLVEVDFTECDMSGSVLDGCDLNRATFQNTNIERSDFRNAVNYSIDPDMNRIKKAKFSIHGISGLLDKYNIDISL